jgi:hypothetical protein
MVYNYEPCATCPEEDRKNYEKEGSIDLAHNPSDSVHS